MAISSPPISITRPLTTQEVHVNNLHETSKVNDDQGEDSLDQFYFLKLPHNPFHFEI